MGNTCTSDGHSAGLKVSHGAADAATATPSGSDAPRRRHSSLRRHQAQLAPIEPLPAPRESDELPSHYGDAAGAPVTLLTLDHDEGGSPQIDRSRGLNVVHTWLAAQQRFSADTSDSSAGASAEDLEDAAPELPFNSSLANDAALVQAELWSAMPPSIAAAGQPAAVMGAGAPRFVSAIGLATPKLPPQQQKCFFKFLCRNRNGANGASFVNF